MVETTAEPQDVGNPSRELLALVIIAYLPLFFVIWIASTFEEIFAQSAVIGLVGLSVMYSVLAAAELYGFARRYFPLIKKWAANRSLLHRAVQLFALVFVLMYGCILVKFSADQSWRLSNTHSLFGVLSDNGVSDSKNVAIAAFWLSLVVAFAIFVLTLLPAVFRWLKLQIARFDRFWRCMSQCYTEEQGMEKQQKGDQSPK